MSFPTNFLAREARLEASMISLHEIGRVRRAETPQQYLHVRTKFFKLHIYVDYSKYSIHLQPLIRGECVFDIARLYKKPLCMLRSQFLVQPSVEKQG